MFKKLGILVLTLSLLLVTGCGKTDETDNKQTTETNKVNTEAYDVLKEATADLNAIEISI